MPVTEKQQYGTRQYRVVTRWAFVDPARKKQPKNIPVVHLREDEALVVDVVTVPDTVDDGDDEPATQGRGGRTVQRVGVSCRYPLLQPAAGLLS